MATKATSGLIDMIRNGQRMTQGQMLKLTLQLSMPAIMAQVSNVAMQYIDASMVGRLGAEDSAAIGIISTTTWLFSGVASAIATGFAVQVAHSIGGNNAEKARSVFRQSLTVCVIAGLVMASIGCSISHWLPIWLGGEAGVCESHILFCHLLGMPAGDCAQLPWGKHAQVQRQHELAEHNEPADVCARCGI